MNSLPSRGSASAITAGNAVPRAEGVARVKAEHAYRLDAFECGAGSNGSAGSIDPAIRLSVVVAAYAGLAGLQMAFDAWPATLVTVLLLAFLLSTMLPIMHEAAHGNIAPGRWANDLVGRVAGTLLTVNYSLYRRYHLGHHARLGEPDDPELPVELRGLGDYLSLYTPRYLLLPFWKLAWQTATHRRPPPFLDRPQDVASAMTDVRLQMIWLATVGIGLVVAPATVVFSYLLPLALAPAWIFFTTLPEHYPLEDRSGPLTRSVTSNRLLSYLLWNTNYHAEHHEAPQCPYWRLPSRASAGRNETSVVHAGSFVRFHIQVLASLRRLRRAA